MASPLSPASPEDCPQPAVNVAELLDGAGTVHAAVETVGHPWAMLVLTSLAAGPSRYGQLKTDVTGINDRMLSLTLQRFTRDGLVHRQVVAAKRSCVEYRLTPLGHQVALALGDFLRTVLDLAPEVARARAQAQAGSGAGAEG
ncbi:helix-turn-helix domain-containing protein [Nocardioides sp.]|uniref:winged helix-turn-helix transcriptional regulator n=1 Tax=Nocardioides sp. TaxID=35761 RepID=UPI002632031D|nr:helix-turn-helix domain-containing protein [Nocardioides sp.]